MISLTSALREEGSEGSWVGQGLEDPMKGTLSSSILWGARKLEWCQSWCCLRQGTSFLTAAPLPQHHVNKLSLAAGCSEEEGCITFWIGNACSAKGGSLEMETAVICSSRHSAARGWALQPAGPYQQGPL